VNSLAQGLLSLAGPGHGTVTSLSASGSPVYAALNSFLPAKETATTGKPKAYLNWMMLDNQFNYVSGQSGALQVGNSDILNTLAQGVGIHHSGYLYIWVSNETQSWDVFFDNLSVNHYSGPMVEENHYYAFGLTMAGISDKALKGNYAENKFRYNGGSELQNKEFSDGSGLEAYDATFRMYDPQIGRFWQIDPLADIDESWSPYSFVNDNPMSFNDPLGLTDSIPGLKDYTPAPIITPDRKPAPSKPVNVDLAETNGSEPNVTAPPLSGAKAPKKNSGNNKSSDQNNTTPPASTVDNAPSNTSYFDLALKYANVPYTHDGVSPKGFDCSGLICLVTGHPGKDHVWSTQGHDPPPGNWTRIHPATSSYDKFLTDIARGDLFVWRYQHTAFYAGHGQMFGAHDFGKLSGYSKSVIGYNELKQYWIQKHGYPEVYRQK
jgi:RHS repeat-associated protein